MKNYFLIIISFIMMLCCNFTIVSFLDKYNYEFESGSGFVYKVENNEVIIVQYA